MGGMEMLARTSQTKPPFEDAEKVLHIPARKRASKGFSAVVDVIVADQQGREIVHSEFSPLVPWLIISVKANDLYMG